MRKGSILPIALMAFAIVAFLFVVTYAVTPGLKYPWSTNQAKIVTNTVVTTNTTTNVNTVANTNTTANENSERNNDTVTTNVEYPLNAAMQYSTRADVTQAYYFGVSNLDKAITTPFSQADYNSVVTTYGILFWKKGETKTTRFTSFGTEDIPYETGVQPDFRWYDFRTKEFVTLPTLTWAVGDITFERVFSVHVSTTEPLVVIEVGSYDIHSTAFEPGLIDSQPMTTRGVVYNPVSNAFLSTDPLGVYLKALGSTTTQWQGFTWDSKNNLAASVPGGEGCGAYSSMTFVNTKTGTKTLINPLTANHWGGYDYEDSVCNPHNGHSPDGKWFILYGKNIKGLLSVRLFQMTSGDTVLKTVTVPYATADDSFKTWDTTGEFPKITTDKGRVIDFNK